MIDTTTAEQSLKLAFNVRAVKAIATVHIKLREMASRFSSSSTFRENLLELSRKAALLRHECYSSAEKSEKCVALIFNELIPKIRKGEDDKEILMLLERLHKKIEETKKNAEANLYQTMTFCNDVDRVSTARSKESIDGESRERILRKKKLEKDFWIADQSVKETDRTLRRVERKRYEAREKAEWADSTSSTVYGFLFTPFLVVYEWHHKKKAYALGATAQDLQKDLAEEESIAAELKAEFEQEKRLIEKLRNDIEIAANEIKDLSGQYNAQADFWNFVKEDSYGAKSSLERAATLKFTSKAREHRLKTLEEKWKRLERNISQYREALAMTRY
ncbi:kinesin-like protein KIF3A [Oscarella lobularis]|uniref:kinesin-like protein KIF3A n=1 Tax=Oscarella lobularis TaxID=121494 RepID=UPI003314072F